METRTSGVVVDMQQRLFVSNNDIVMCIGILARFHIDIKRLYKVQRRYFGATCFRLSIMDTLRFSRTLVVN